MDITSVSVGYSRKLSDGNYGSEEVSVAYTAPVAEGQRPAGLTKELVNLAREAALAQLRDSTARTVRLAASAMTEDERRHDAYQSDRDAWEKHAQRYVEKPQVDEEDDPDQGGL